jgi:hypothetical protein
VDVEPLPVEGPVEVEGATQDVKIINKAAVRAEKNDNRLTILTIHTPLQSQAFQFGK